MNNLRGFKDTLSKCNVIKCYTKKKIINYFNYLMFYKVQTPIVELYKNFNILNNNFNNELYKFLDYGKKIICLRPELTTCIHRINKKNFKLNKIIYYSSVFRYEKPQKKKLRQFTQFGIELYNNNIIYEIYILKKINILLSNFKIFIFEINSFFNFKFKNFYLILLIHYLKKKFFYNINKQINIYKIFENKKFNFKKFLFNFKFLNFKNKILIKKFLFNLSNNVIYNPKLLRGINYYSNFIFEWKCKFHNFSVCGGGGYSYFSNFINKKINSSFGLAIGVERLLIKKKYIKKKIKIKTNLFFLNFKNIYYSKNNENIIIKKINIFYIKIIIKKKFFVIKKKNYSNLLNIISHLTK